MTNREVILGDWSAGIEELFEVTRRIVAGRHGPKWPDRATDSVGNELHALRQESALLAAVAAVPSDCDACGGSGLAVIPVKACVWEGRLVLHPEFKRVVTGAVICDRPGCAAGERMLIAERNRKTDRPRATLSRAERCHGRDLVAMLRDFERAEAARARQRAGSDNGLSQSLGNLLAVLRAGRAAAGGDDSFSAGG